MNNLKKLIFLILAVGIFSCTEPAPPATPSTSITAPNITNPTAPEIGKVTMPDGTVKTPQPSTQLADATPPKRKINPMTGNVDMTDHEFDEKSADIAQQLEGMGNVDVGKVKMIKPPSNPDIPNLSNEARENLYNNKIQDQMAFVLKLVSQQYRMGKLGSRLSKTPSGLEYITVDIGKGKPAVDDSFVAFKSIGATMDGEVFEENFEKDRAHRVKLGTNSLVPGLEEALKTMRSGGRAIFFVPPALAYGNRGRIGVPPNSMVVYSLNLQSVN